jgi:hypothetical protein
MRVKRRRGADAAARRQLRSKIIALPLRAERFDHHGREADPKSPYRNVAKRTAVHACARRRQQSRSALGRYAVWM